MKNGISTDVEAACVMINGGLIWLMLRSAASHGPSSHILFLASLPIFYLFIYFPFAGLYLYTVNVTLARPV